jgi:hypothetical protein
VVASVWCEEALVKKSQRNERKKDMTAAKGSVMEAGVSKGGKGKELEDDR